ncbi:MAG: hypothetical protein HOI95_08710, partial [Chromatiales bacterium]|nr:hypothetical protein [Chromatiales bacterium]
MQTPPPVSLSPLGSGQRIQWFEIESVIYCGPYVTRYGARDTTAAPGVVVRVIIDELLPESLCMRDEGGNAVPRSSGDALIFADVQRRFEREAEVLRTLGQRGAAACLLVCREFGTSFMVSEWVEGTALDAWAQSLGRFEHANLVGVAAPLLAALQSIHEAGLAHGRIDPDHVRIRADGSGAFVGFSPGLAFFERRLGASVAPAMLSYRAPDMPGATASQHFAASDIYGLGALLYQLATGNAPTPAKERASSRHDPLRRATAAADGDGLQRHSLLAIESALELAPERRPTSTQLREALLYQHTSDRLTELSGRLRERAANFRQVRLPAARMPTRIPKSLGLLAAVVMIYLGGLLAWQLGVIDDVAIVLFGDRTPITTAQQDLNTEPEAGDGSGSAPVVVDSYDETPGDAERALLAPRITTPPTDDALDRFVDVLSNDPGNNRALAGVNAILSFYASRARAAEDSGDLEQALERWARVESIALAMDVNVALSGPAKLWLDTELEVARQATASLRSRAAKPEHQFPTPRPKPRSIAGLAAITDVHIRLGARATRLAKEAGAALSAG